MLDSELFIWSILKNNEIPLPIHWNSSLSFSYEEYTQSLDIINKSKDKLKIIKKNKGIKQRSEKWYLIRSNMITASDTHSAIKQYKSLIRKKALQININISNDAIKWGILFEPVATKIYSILNNRIKIHEFGLLTYNEYNHYGASPDGISELGIMLEIKCPYTREIIDDDIPIKYYDQMQGQLAVCGLDLCDYAEFSFQEIDLNTYLNLDKHSFCGMIVEQPNNNIVYSKIYEDPHLSYSKYIKLDSKKITYWKLKKYNIQRVTFDKDLWYNDYLPKIKEFWNKVLLYEEPQYQYLDDSD